MRFELRKRPVSQRGGILPRFVGGSVKKGAAA